MNKLSIFAIRGLRYGYQKVFGMPSYPKPAMCDAAEGGELICQSLSDDKPCMIARYGANELNCVSNYLEITCGEHNIWKNIKGESHDWWWNEGMLRELRGVAGFYPVDNHNLTKFSKLMLADSKDLDVLAVFPAVYKNLSNVESYIPPNIPYIHLVSFDSFLFKTPWTRVLEGKDVLVVHPFAELIESQYQKRELLFDNKSVLPKFNLKTIKAVQSMAGVNKQGFKDWFEGLYWMEQEMDKQKYDIALLGCGAYGFPLAAHAKRTGHKAVHIGGSLQLLFGIKGKRWEDTYIAIRYNIPPNSYIDIMNNPNWVRPDQYVTKETQNAEGGCYL